jgi:exodeoxyribonuclease VII large subunit
MSVEPAGPPEVLSRLTVSQLHVALGRAIAAAELDHLWITGVVNSLRERPRFTSFELVEYQPDATTVRAVLPVGMFGREARHLAQTLAAAGVALEDGLEVAVYGRLETNGAYGPLRLVALDVDPRVTIGAAVLARDQLVAELTASGELEAQRRLVVPELPRRIGLVCSRSTAGHADSLALLEASPYPFRVIEAPAVVSGPNAPLQIARAIRRLSAQRVELLLIVRGGGAKSELAAWDAPEVARGIAGCPLPVWVAVGHATDRSVADLVANASFPTPSAAVGALVARAKAHAVGEAMAAQARTQATELLVARRRARRAVAVAVVLMLLALAVILVAAL